MRTCSQPGDGVWWSADVLNYKIKELASWYDSYLDHPSTRLALLSRGIMAPVNLTCSRTLDMTGLYLVSGQKDGQRPLL